MNPARLIVMKFGGTSVGNAARFRECATIINNAIDRDRIIVVVSAVAGITDLILSILRAAEQGDKQSMEANLARCEAIHCRLAEELFRRNRLELVKPILAGYIDQLSGSCRALCALASPSAPQIVDVLLAIGEKLSACLFANYLCELGPDAQFIRGEDVIATDDSFGNAVPDMEATKRNCAAHIVPVLSRGAIPVVAGFSGATARGQTTTLGRGGSDYSATTIAAASASDEVWIWTDVDGVLSADPRLCPEAAVLSEINFAEAIELSYYGAKVIHRKAIYPVLQCGFPVYIKNSFRPQAQGTRINQSTRNLGPPFYVVTSLVRTTLITLLVKNDAETTDVLGRLFLRLGQDRIDVLLAIHSFTQVRLELIVRYEDEERVLNLIRTILHSEFARGWLSPLSVRNDIALVSVVSRCEQGAWPALGLVVSALAERDIHLIAMAGGASDRSICFVVPSVSSAEAVGLIHKELNQTRTSSSVFAPETSTDHDQEIPQTPKAIGMDQLQT